MKNRVKLSAYCIIITIAVALAIIVAIVSSRGNKDAFIILSITLVMLIGTGLFYSPKYIEISEDALIIQRSLNSKVIQYSDISTVDRCMPSAGGLRLCGSGGFMGYWGYFSDIIIGTYFGYYGDRNQCILIKLKNGRQYVISCTSPTEMTNAINEKL